MQATPLIMAYEGSESTRDNFGRFIQPITRPLSGNWKGTQLYIYIYIYIYIKKKQQHNHNISMASSRGIIGEKTSNIILSCCEFDFFFYFYPQKA